MFGGLAETSSRVSLLSRQHVRVDFKSGLDILVTKPLLNHVRRHAR
jgi:hypothetical protein